MSFKQFYAGIRGFLGVTLPIITFAIAITALYFALNARRNVQLEVFGENFSTAESEIVLLEAENVFNRAEDAVSSAELILSFLEGAGVLVTVVLLGAGILGLTTIQDFRRDSAVLNQEVIQRLEQAEQELIQRVERAEQELLAKAEQLAALEAQLESTFEKSEQRIDLQVQAATETARRAFEALSQHVMAQRLARENNINAAIKACLEARQLDRDSMPNNYLLGTLMLRKNRLDEAVQYFTEAYRSVEHESERASAPVQAALGLAIRKKGDQVADTMERNRVYNRAENYLLDATQKDPHLLTEDKESYLGVLGSLYRRQGREDDAIAAYSQAAQTTPRRSYPEINLAMLYLAQNKRAEFEKHRQLAEVKANRRLDDSPEDYWAKYDLALAKLLQSETAQAVQLFDEALELTPDVMTLDSILARLNYLHSLNLDLNGVASELQKFQVAYQRLQNAD